MSGARACLGNSSSAAALRCYTARSPWPGSRVPRHGGSPPPPTPRARRPRA